MNAAKSLLFAGFAAMLVFGGCGGEQQFKAVERICVPGISKSEAMAAAEDVLGQMQFAVEKSDAESGYIRSRPLPGAQGFEFWRKDNVGAFNAAEANLHSIRRTVEMDISREEGGFCVGCGVRVQRLNLPEREVSSSAQAYRMFSRSNLSRQELEVNPDQKAGLGWVELGEDARLSTEILKRVKRKLTTKEK